MIIMLPVITRAAGIEVLYNKDNQQLTVKGKVTDLDLGKYNNQVTVQIFKPGKNVEDLKTTSNIKDVLCLLEEKEPGSSGDFELKFKMDGERGKYIIRVLLPRQNSYYTSEIYHANAVDYENARIAINEVNDVPNAQKDAAMKAVIEENFELLDLSFSIYEDMAKNDTSLSFLVPVYKALTKLVPFNDIESIVSAYKGEIVVQALKKAKSPDEAKDIISNQKAYLKLDDCNAYSKTHMNLVQENSSALGLIHQAIINGSFNDAETFREFFSQQIILKSIYKVSNWTAVRQILNDNRVFLSGFKFSIYDQLNDTTEKPQVDIKIAGESFNDINALKVRFNEITQEVYESRKKESGSTVNNGGDRKTVILKDPAASLIPAVPTPVANLFDDLGEYSWAEESINELAALGIVNGYEGHFNPAEYITREQFIKMLVLAFNLFDETEKTEFSDIQQGEWYVKYIASAQKYGITNGIGNNLFGIGKEVTRQEMAELAFRTAKLAAEDKILLSSSDKRFIDENEISEYAREGIQVMREAGIVNGLESNKFAPGKYSTRAEAAKVIYGLVKLLKH